MVRKGEDVGKDAAHHSSKDRDGGPYVKTRRKLLNHVVDGLRIQEREGIAERNLDFLYCVSANYCRGEIVLTSFMLIFG